MYELLWIFFLYAFLGWCAEVVFAAAKTGAFVNRGFLLGPVCPIYGLGVSFVLLALKPLGDNLLVLFVGSVVITSALEYLVGWLAEKVMHQQLWDYSTMPFNLNGYICLAFSLMWGIACILVVRVLHPLILTTIRWIPHTLGLVLLILFAATFVADLALTLADALKLPKQMKAAEDVERLIRGLSDNLGEGLYHGVSKLELDEKKEELSAWKEKNDAKKRELEEKLANYRAIAGKNRTYRRLSRAFPNLKNSAHHKRLERIRAYLEQHEQERKLPMKHKISRYFKEATAHRSLGVVILYLSLRLIVVGMLVLNLFQREYEAAFTCILALILFLMPSFVEKRLNIDLPNTLEVIVLLFIFAHEILGELGSYYITRPYWDTMLHTTSGFLFSAVGFAMIDILNQSRKTKFNLSPLYCAVAAFCFSMTIGVLWEFFEFGMDWLFHYDMQKDTIIRTISSTALDPTMRNIVIHTPEILETSINGQTLVTGGYLDIGLFDTMEDLFVNFIGAVVFSIIGFFYVKHEGKGKLASQFIPTFNENEEESK